MSFDGCRPGTACTLCGHSVCFGFLFLAAQRDSDKDGNPVDEHADFREGDCGIVEGEVGAEVEEVGIGSEWRRAACNPRWRTSAGHALLARLGGLHFACSKFATTALPPVDVYLDPFCKLS